MASIFDRIRDASTAWMRAPDGANRARDDMARDVSQRGPEVFNPAWVTTPVLTQQEAVAAELSIRYAYAPPPVPAKLVARTPAARALQQDMVRLQEQAALPQQVMGRQLAMRTPIDGEKSFASTIEGWAKEAEDPVMAAALGAKTDTGVLREIALTGKRQLAIDAELVQAQAETNALLAMLLAKQLKTEMDVVARDMLTASESKQ